MDRLLPRWLGDLVGPMMDHGVTVDVFEVGEDPSFEFCLGRDADVAEH